MGNPFSCGDDGVKDTQTTQRNVIDPGISDGYYRYASLLKKFTDDMTDGNPNRWTPGFDTVAGPTRQTTDALGNITQLAQQGNPYQAATQSMFNTGAGQYGDLARTGGFNPGMDMARTAAQGGLGNQFTGRAASVADGGLWNTTNPMLQGIAEGSLANQKAGMAETVAHGGLYNTDRQLFDSFINGGRAITAGNLVSDMAAPGASNPYLDSMFGRAADQVQGRVQGAMNRNGNLNSSFNQAGMQDALSGLATDIYGGQYQQGQQNRLAAAGLMGQFQGQNQQAALQAASQAAGTTAQDRDRQLAGVQLAVNSNAQDRDRQLQGASLLQNSVNQDRQRQLEGVNQLLNTSAQDRARQMQGIDLTGQLGQQSIQNRLNALQGQQGLMSMMPGLNDARYTDAINLLNAGQTAEGYTQRNMDARYRDWSNAQNAPLDVMSSLGSIWSSLAGNGGMVFGSQPIKTPGAMGNINLATQALGNLFSRGGQGGGR